MQVPQPSIQKKTLPYIEVKEHVSTQVAPQKIEYIQFGLFSPSQMQQMGEMQVSNTGLYAHPTKNPVPWGLLDPRLGISQSTQGECQTCGKGLIDCAGHFGFVDLYLPVFHIGLLPHIHACLRMICKSCSRVLLSPDERKKYTKVLSRERDYPTRLKQHKTIIEICRKKSQCPWCGDWNGEVKKIAAMRFCHMKWDKTKKSITEKQQFVQHFKDAQQTNKEVENEMLDKAGEDLTPLVCRTLFSKIPPEDLVFLDMVPTSGRPEDMILTHIPVPPCCLRPAVNTGSSASNQDDLTMQIKALLHCDNSIRQAVKMGDTVPKLMGKWDFLQFQAALLFNSTFPGCPAELKTKKPIRGVCQRLKGKQGRFRGNLSGKRVDFTGRTVISPDPNLGVHEVGIPRLVAETLTYPERVNAINFSRMRELVRIGQDAHPGARFVLKPDGTLKRALNYSTGTVARWRDKYANELQIGDIVERHINDGDIVLFNRQPSLHRISIMAHQVKVLPGKTFRFNECCCAPYNADFDGDEMNVHVPQTEEARAEAKCLMASIKNLATPKNGALLIAATQDFLTSSFLITNKDRFYDRAAFMQIVSHFSDGKIGFTLPHPAILKPVELFTGKQVISLLIKHNKKDDTCVNLERKNKNYDPKKNLGVFDAKEGMILIRNGELLCGALDKDILGGGKNNLFQLLLRDFGDEIAGDRMSKLARLSSRWIGDHGFSIGIEDVTPGERLKERKTLAVEEGYVKCNEKIKQFSAGKLVPEPGCTAEQTLEAQVTGILSSLRDEIGLICLEELPKHNSPLIMVQCGSKGNNANISQMISSVGQQTVGGSRIPNGFYKRTLPHFKMEDARSPVAKGFVSNSFFSGLLPPEFFFHTMGGREGLIDTAVKTAETGYMQRRLMKALEDLSIQYDMTVRSSSSQIVQFTYGDDGIEPTYMEDDKEPLNWGRQMTNLLNRNLDPERDEITKMRLPPLTDDQIKEIFDAEFKKNLDLQQIPPKHVESLKTFLEGMTDFVGYYRLDRKTLISFLTIVGTKMRRAIAEPGTAIGALCAQSIGEPCTQMTLKTFHFAGVASMNITQGVPRIREIMNATKTISTPFITAQLANPTSEEAARRVHGKIERVKLGDIIDYISEVYKPEGGAYLEIKLDWELVNELYLTVSIKSIIQAIVKDKTQKLKLKECHIDISGNYHDKLVVKPPDSKNIYYSLQNMKAKLPLIIVSGIPTISRCVVANKEKNEAEYELLVEGTGLKQVLAIPGVNFAATVTNHALEAAEVLGIEAGRRVIIEELNTVMTEHRVSVDSRHLKLLADLMTYKGEILGITRGGIGKMKDSILMLASFEKTTDFLFNSAVYGIKDKVAGVSECIIMGSTVPLGTGLFSLMHLPEVPQNQEQKKKALKGTPKVLRELKKKPLLLESNFKLPFSTIIS